MRTTHGDRRQVRRWARKGVPEYLRGKGGCRLGGLTGPPAHQKTEVVMA